MSERMSLYPTKKLKTAVKKLAEMQRRSESEMAIILIEEGLRVFRNEWKRTGGTVPSNNKLCLVERREENLMFTVHADSPNYSPHGLSVQERDADDLNIYCKGEFGTREEAEAYKRELIIATLEGYIEECDGETPNWQYFTDDDGNTTEYPIPTWPSKFNYEMYDGGSQYYHVRRAA